MHKQPQKKKSQESTKAKVTLPHQGFKVLWLMIGLSLLLHFGSYVNLSYFAPDRSTRLPRQNKVTVRIVPKKKAETPQADRKLVEAPQEKTKPPVDAKYKSFQDHQTDKETKVADSAPRTPGADAGNAGFKKDFNGKKERRALSKVTKTKKKQKLKIESDIGSLAVEQNRKAYKKLIPSSEELASVMDAGYQDYIDEELTIADRIDINTKEYRYMGYFSAMRKSIELVWNYPGVAARRGMQGEVGLEFIIHKNGSTSRVRVIRSSGYKILDDAIVEAIQLASPFSPLPPGFGKEKMLVTGSFRYILSSFLAGAH